MSNFEIIPVSSAGTLDISPASNELSILDSFEALEFEFDDAVDKASRLDYGIAAGSGLLTGLLSVFLGKPLSVEEAAKIGGKEADKIVIDAARAFGCDLPNDKAIFDKDGRCSTEVLAKAIKFLEDKFPIPQDSLPLSSEEGFSTTFEISHTILPFSASSSPSSANLRARATAPTRTATSSSCCSPKTPL